MIKYENLDVTIQTGHLKAATMFAETKGTDRYYLKGIYFEPTATGHIMVATNGHIMFVAKHDATEQCDVKEFAPFIMPIEAAKKALIGHKFTGTKIEAGSDYENRAFHKVNGLEFIPVGAKYPNWRRVIPEQTSGEVSDFCPNYIGTIGKAIKAITGKNAAGKIWHNGDKAAIVSLSAKKDCFAIIMPKKVDYFHSDTELVKSVLHGHDMLQAVAAE